MEKIIQEIATSLQNDCQSAIGNVLREKILRRTLSDNQIQVISQDVRDA